MTATVETGRVALTVNGTVFNRWTEVDVGRDLRELAGTFNLKLLDKGRLPGSTLPKVSRGDACTVAIDGETVLTGWIDVVEIAEEADTLSFSVQGRDKTGDLVDCAAAPNGPAEYRNIDLTAFATAICAPFGIPVKADIDVGAAFDTLSLQPHDTALAAIESAARQRSALVTSDGVGGLLLTRGGATRAPGSLVRGLNIVGLQRRDDGTKRYSDVFVKGQSARGAGCRRGSAAAVSVGSAASAPTTPANNAVAGILITGHAQDPEITRWRPYVKETRSQSGMTSAQEQAEWLVRVFKGQALELNYRVLDWRAGPPSGTGPVPLLGALWRPNTVVPVYDPLVDIAGDMLIAGVRYQLSEKGLLTLFRVVGTSAYDQVDEAYSRRDKFAPQVQPKARKGSR